MNIQKIRITTPLLISAVLVLGGCASTGGSSVLPQSGPTMSEIYHQQYGGGQSMNELKQFRSGERTVSLAQSSDASDSGEVGPNALPNPTIAMYVSPHFDGNDQNYIPGHMAYTKMYKDTHFALPGEPTELK